MARMKWAAATAPATEASCFSAEFLRPLPPKKAAPPCETWRMMGELMSRAASRQALTIDDEVTFCLVSSGPPGHVVERNPSLPCTTTFTAKHRSTWRGKDR